MIFGYYITNLHKIQQKAKYIYINNINYDIIVLYVFIHKEGLMLDYINIEGAKVNNLKNINVKIPRDKLTVVTGLSGSR